MGLSKDYALIRFIIVIICIKACLYYNMCNLKNLVRFLYYIKGWVLHALCPVPSLEIPDILTDDVERKPCLYL